MLQKSGRLVLWEAMFILELHSAETQGKAIFPFKKQAETSVIITANFCLFPYFSVFFVLFPFYCVLSVFSSSGFL